MELTLGPLALALIPVILGLVEAAKRIGLPARWAPLVSIALGIVAGVLYLDPADPRAGVLSGLVLALSAMGLWSGGKATVEQVQRGKPNVPAG